MNAKGGIYTGYTTWGPVRGGCGHVHLTMDAAAECAAKDARKCAAAGGYSDRRVRRLEGPTRNDLRQAAKSYDVRFGPGKPVEGF